MNEIYSLSLPVCFARLNLLWAFFTSMISVNLRRMARSKSSHVRYPSSSLIHGSLQASHHGDTLGLSQSRPAMAIFTSSPTYLDGDTLKQSLRFQRNTLRFLGSLS